MSDGPSTFTIDGEPYTGTHPFGMPALMEQDGKLVYASVHGVYCLLGDHHEHFTAPETTKGQKGS